MGPVCGSHGLVGGTGDSSVGGDEVGSAVLGVAVRRLVCENRLEDRYHTGGSCWSLSICEQTRIGLT